MSFKSFDTNHQKLSTTLRFLDYYVGVFFFFLFFFLACLTACKVTFIYIQKPIQTKPVMAYLSIIKVVMHDITQFVGFSFSFSFFFSLFWGQWWAPTQNHRAFAMRDVAKEYPSALDPTTRVRATANMRQKHYPT